MKIDRNVLINRAKKSMNGKWQDGWCDAPSIGAQQQNATKMESFQFGLCYTDPDGNSILYSFKTKKFYYFKYENDLNKNMNNEISYGKAESMIKQWEMDSYKERSSDKYSNLSTKLAIYESYINNDITNEEKTELLLELYEEKEINEGRLVMEGVFKDSTDIYYNKDKYDSGQINLLFIIGYSGGGKSTMSNSQVKLGREIVDMDKLIFGIAQSPLKLKSKGVFHYKFAMGPGKKYRDKILSLNGDREKIKEIFHSEDYKKSISNDLFKFAKSYSASHKSTRLIIEGVWIYRYVNPEEAKNYAVYIKGTSLATSTKRAVKRDIGNGLGGGKVVGAIKHSILKTVSASKDALAGSLGKWQKMYYTLYMDQLKAINKSVQKTSLVTNIKKDIKNKTIADDVKTLSNSAIKVITKKKG